MSHWPSEEKLARLRSEGQVAVSFVSLRLIASCAVLIALFFLLPGFEAWLDRWKLAWQDLGVSSPSELQELFAGIQELFLVPILLVPVFVFIWGLLQSLFLFRMEALSINFAKLFTGFPSLKALSVALGRYVMVLILSASLAVLSSLYLESYLRYAFLRPPQDFAPYLRQLLETPFFALLVLVPIASVLFWLLNKLLFLLEHRTSSAELEKELREHD